ncbi:MAG TPA: PilX N-terminal domain-containing pilus assembly protein [Tahibacter sp.]|nr:PilX N-terminal domain-containing pilus assembly protein [Tahibacter sp.]
MNTSVRPFSPIQQRGAALFVALVFLILLTILGIAASGSSVLQERMTGGARNRQLAMMGVESAVRGGEFDVWSAAARANFSGGGDVMVPCSAGATECVFVSHPRTGALETAVQDFRTSRTWSPTTGNGIRAYTPQVSGLSGDTETASLASQPRYIIEDLGRETGKSKKKMQASRLAEGNTGVTRSLYRVTARSQGGSSQAAVRIAESVYSAYGTNHQYNPDSNPTP